MIGVYICNLQRETVNQLTLDAIRYFDKNFKLQIRNSDDDEELV